MVRLKEIRHALNRIVSMHGIVREVSWEILKDIIYLDKPCKIIVYIFDHNQKPEVIHRLSILATGKTPVSILPPKVVIGNCQIWVISVLNYEQLVGNDCDYYYID